MKIVDIADEIYKELSSPTELSIPSITFWLRGNVGALNNYIHTDFIINETSLEIEKPSGVAISASETAILKKMYRIHYYDTQVKQNIGAANLDPVIEVSDGGSSIRKINKSTIISSLVGLKGQEYNELQLLIRSYNQTFGSPRQVTGDDTIEGSYGGNGGSHNRTGG